VKDAVTRATESQGEIARRNGLGWGAGPCIKSRRPEREIVGGLEAAAQERYRAAGHDAEEFPATA
jgi:hypothetical protein